MADIVTGTTTGQVNTSQLHQDHADIRREGAVERGVIRHDVAQAACELGKGQADIRQESARNSADNRYASALQSADIRREVADEACAINQNVSKTGWHVSDRVGTEADRIVGQATAHFIAQQQEATTSARDIAGLRATTELSRQALQMEIQNGIDRAAAATALEGAKNAAATALESAKVASAVQLSQGILERTILADGNSTRALINDMKYHDNNRYLIERNAELVECKSRSDRFHGDYTNAQWAALTNQMNAFQSQLQETRQGMVNFGSMNHVGQTSTSNNVR